MDEERMRRGNLSVSVLYFSFGALTLLVGCHTSSEILLQNR